MSHIGHKSHMNPKAENFPTGIKNPVLGKASNMTHLTKKIIQIEFIHLDSPTIIL